MGPKIKPAQNRFLMIVALILNILTLINASEPIIVPRQEESVAIVTNEKRQNEIPKRIILDSVNIDLPVIESPFENGSWVASEHFASYAQGTSPLDSSYGNTLIFAHARSKLFKPIIKAKEGDVVRVYSESKIYYYKIVDREIVSPYNVEVLESPAKHIITLLTCVGVDDENRLLLQGELIGLSESKFKEVI